MLAVPYWLTGHSIDELVGDNLLESNEIRQEFIRIFEQEGINMTSKQMPVLASIYEGWRPMEYSFSIVLHLKML
jgi:hypothetical protein